MIELVRLEKSDIDRFTEITIDSFEEDIIMYGEYPPLIDIENRALRFIHQGDTYKILKADELIGGTVIFKNGEGHYILGAIFIHPSYQNQGYGQQVIQLIEEKYPDAKSWFLDTPYLSVRNHHFYEKMGYIKVGEEIPDKESDFKLFLYKKVINSIP